MDGSAETNEALRIPKRHGVEASLGPLRIMAVPIRFTLKPARLQRCPEEHWILGLAIRRRAAIVPHGLELLTQLRADLQQFFPRS